MVISLCDGFSDNFLYRFQPACAVPERPAAPWRVTTTSSSMTLIGSAFRSQKCAPVLEIHSFLEEAVGYLAVHSPGFGIAGDSSLVRFSNLETSLHRPAHLQQGHLTILKRICHHTAMK